MQMPTDFTGCNPLTPENRKTIEAIREEAISDNETLMHGTEVLGNIMFCAGVNSKNSELSKNSLASMGSLISHIAMQMQFLHELEQSIRLKLGIQDARAAAERESSLDQVTNLAQKIKEVRGL